MLGYVQLCITQHILQVELPLTDLIITQPGNQLHEKFKQLRARDAEDIITARVILLSSWQPDYRINMQTTPARLASISATKERTKHASKWYDAMPKGWANSANNDDNV